MAYTTRKTLLDAIKGQKTIYWDDFYNTYRPLIAIRGYDMHLTPTEVDDLIQAVMLKFFRQSRSFVYDPAQGKFRNYLGVIIKQCASDILRQRPAGLSSGNANEDMDESFEQLWDKEYQRYLMIMAMQRLKKEIGAVTYQAFELYALKNEDPRKVAAFLNITVNMVYVAKSRATAKLRKLIRELQKEEE